MMAYRIDLFNASDERVAILQDEILTSCDLDSSTSAAPTLTLSMPLSEDKSSYISPLYYAKIWNTQSAAYEFSVFELLDPDIVDSNDKLYIKAKYQGILTRLSEEHIDTYDTTSSGAAFNTVITALLAFQVNTPPITVGTIEPTDTIAITAESSDIYSVLNSIKKAYGGWFEVDNSYALNWYEDNTGDPMREVRRSKNLKAINYTSLYSRVVNRVYAYGKGESDARLNLTDAGEAEEYIDDAASQAIYGVRARKYIDKSITHPTTLLAYAQRILAEYKTPPYQYSVDVVNLAEVDDYDYTLESLGLDTRVRVVDDLLSVDVDTSIVSMSVNLLAPEEISIELSTVKNDLSDLFGGIINNQDIASSVATQIGAGQVTVLGTFTVEDWTSAGTTKIVGDNITTGTLTACTITLDVSGGTGEGVIQSSNYVADTSGFQINGDGDAEFNDVIVRGTIGSGSALLIDGDLKTTDGKFEIKTTGVTLKSGDTDTTYLELNQDTAEIRGYDGTVERVKITPTGAITLVTDLGTPLTITNTADSDCINITTAYTSRRGIVCVTTPGATSMATASIHVTNNTSGGYAIYAGGKINSDDLIEANTLYVASGSQLRATTISGNLTMDGTANILNVNKIEASTIDTGEIINSSGSYIRFSSDISMGAYDITCNQLNLGGDTHNSLTESGGDLYWRGTKIN